LAVNSKASIPEQVIRCFFIILNLSFIILGVNVLQRYQYLSNF